MSYTGETASTKIVNVSWTGAHGSQSDYEIMGEGTDSRMSGWYFFKASTQR